MKKKILAGAIPFIAALMFAASSSAYLNVANGSWVFSYDSSDLARLYYGSSGFVEPTPYSCGTLGYFGETNNICYTRVNDGRVDFLLSRSLPGGTHRYFVGRMEGSNACMISYIDIRTFTYDLLHDHSPFRWTPGGCFG